MRFNPSQALDQARGRPDNDSLFIHHARLAFGNRIGSHWQLSDWANGFPVVCRKTCYCPANCCTGHALYCSAALLNKWEKLSTKSVRKVVDICFTGILSYCIYAEFIICLKEGPLLV